MNNKHKNIFRLLFFTAMVIITNHAFSSEGDNGGIDKTNTLEKSTPLENGPQLENGKPLFKELDEVNGLIINRTMTRLGGDFYSLFAQKLNEKREQLEENITVHERPTALSGSIISVKHGDKPIYRAALSPGRRQAQEKTTEAVDAVNNYLERWKVERLFRDTFDLGSDEL